MQLFTSSLCTCTKEVIRHFYFQLFPFQQKEKPKVRTFVGKVIRTEARRTCVVQVRFSICLFFSRFLPLPLSVSFLPLSLLLSLCLFLSVSALPLSVSFSFSLPPSFSLCLPIPLSISFFWYSFFLSISIAISLCYISLSPPL